MTATATDHYCVFDVAGEVFAASAMQIREITSKPDYAKVPGASLLFAGLWHEGSEFLPMLRLPFQSECHPERETQVLIVHGPHGRWCLLVDQVHTVATIECSHHGDASNTEWSSAMLGMSTWEGRSVRVLNLDGLYRLSEQLIESGWNQQFNSIEDADRLTKQGANP